MNMGIVGVIAVSAYFVSKGTSSVTTVIAFMQYFTLISMAMMSLSRMFVMYTKCAASANRISLVMKSKNELEVIGDDGNYVFRCYSPKIKNADLSSATKVGKDAFGYCLDLETVTHIEKHVRDIASEQFYGIVIRISSVRS